jgi:hypothetical protein
MTFPTPLSWTMLALLAACQGTDPNAGTLSQNVGASFAPCSEAEIKFMATKHNFMPAFRPCGNNKFSHYRWSPDGRRLYFQLVFTAHVMDAEAADKATLTVPTPSPIGPAAWLTSSRLVLPVGPAEGETANRLAVFDVDTPSVYYRSLPGVRAVHDVMASGDLATAIALVDDSMGKGRAVSIDLASGAVSDAFPWLQGPIDTLTLTPKADAVSVGRGETVTLYTWQGEPHSSWTPATRGTVHSGGRWVALEHEGEPVSIFQQRAWDELSERAREREIARTERFVEGLPEDFQTEVRPPTLSLVDLADGERHRITSVQGHRFQWYEAADFYGSFLLWGFESKQFKRNVLLGNFRDRMSAMESDRTMMGVERMAGPTEARPFVLRAVTTAAPSEDKKVEGTAQPPKQADR